MEENQRKEKMLFDDDTSVVLQSFTKKKTRRTNGSLFKLWMFHVYEHSENTFLGVFIWCEKGLPLNYFSIPENIPASEDTETIGSRYNLSLEDLDFLRPFVDARTALSFGW